MTFLQKGGMGTTESELRRMLVLSLSNGSKLYEENKQLRARLAELESEVAKGLSWEQAVRNLK